MKRTVMTVLLSVILVIGVVCGVYFLKQAAALRTDGESAVASAQETLAAAQTRHDAVDPETEDTAYYNSVYEEMQKGVDQVEEYLKGN